MPRRKSDEALILALTCGATVETAAHKAGLSRRTAFRRLADPEFLKRLNEARAEMAQRSSAMLTAAGLESIKTLVTLQQNPSVPATVRRAAATSVIELSLKFRHALEWENRLAILERRLEELPRTIG
jgi:hypothetical protein